MATPEPIPDWLLEQIALDEIPPGRRDEIARRLAADPTSAERVQALRDSNQEILAEIPAEQAVAEIARRHRVAALAARQAAASGPGPRGVRSFFRLAPWASGLAAAGAAVLLAVYVLPGKGGESGSDQKPVLIEKTGSDSAIRIKGDPHLVLHRKRGDAIEKLDRASIARAGDLIQISYTAAGASHGAILSIDGSGAVTLHYPATAEASTRLEPRGTIELTHSYELDDAPDFERFFFITSSQPIDLAAVLAQARQLASTVDREPERLRSQDIAIDRAAGAKQWSFVLAKESRP